MAGQSRSIESRCKKPDADQHRRKNRARRYGSRAGAVCRSRTRCLRRYAVTARLEHVLARRARCIRAHLFRTSYRQGRRQHESRGRGG